MLKNETNMGRRPALFDGAFALLLALVTLYADNAFAVPSVCGSWPVTGSVTVKLLGKSVTERVRDTLVFKKNGRFGLDQIGLQGTWTQKGSSVNASLPASAVKATLVRLLGEIGPPHPIEIESARAIKSTLRLTNSSLKGNFSLSARITVPGTKIRNSKVTARYTFTSESHSPCN